MAKQTFKVRREQDPVLAAAVHSEITPANWHRFPGGVAAGGPQPQYVRTNTWDGGQRGDDVTQSETNVLVDDRGIGDYNPRTQAAKATALGLSFVQDMGSPRGYIDPSEPYGPAPVSPTDDPTITSLTPNTGVSGAGKPPIWVIIAGTKFTQWSTVDTGGVSTPYFKFVSATRIDMLQDPRSTPGTVVVKVRDHGVLSNGSNFTFS
jgi:hypothetical protein